MSRISMRFSDPFTEMHKDHCKLMENLTKFRKDPSSVVHGLKNRLKRYRQISGQTFLFSDKYPKKAVKVLESDTPDRRIRQLVGILQGQTSSLGQTIEVPKLYEYASKICQTICRKIPQEIHFKPETSQLIRDMIDEDSNIKFPNDIYCLVSVAFNEDMQSLLSLLIDDDLPNRPNRKILLNSAFKYAGTCSAIPEGYEHLKCSVYLVTDKALATKNSQIKSSGIRNSNNTNSEIVSNNNIGSQKIILPNNHQQVFAYQQPNSRVSINSQNSFQQQTHPDMNRSNISRSSIRNSRYGSYMSNQ